MLYCRMIAFQFVVRYLGPWMSLNVTMGDFPLWKPTSVALLPASQPYAEKVTVQSLTQCCLVKFSFVPMELQVRFEVISCCCLARRFGGRYLRIDCHCYRHCLAAMPEPSPLASLSMYACQRFLCFPLSPGTTIGVDFHYPSYRRC